MRSVRDVAARSHAAVLFPSTCVLVFAAAASLLWLQHAEDEVGILVYEGAGFVLAGVVVAATMLRRPARRWPWLLIGLVIALDAGGDLAWDVTEFTGHIPGYTSMLSTLLYFASYPVAIVAMTGFLRRRRQTLTVFLDATMYGTAAWAAIWIVFVHPAVGSSGIQFWDWIPTALYPPFDVIVLAALWQVGRGQLRYSSPWRMLFAGFSVMLAADVLYAALLMPDAGLESDLLSIAYLASYGLIAAAAVDPRMARVEAEPVPLLRPVSHRGRIVGHFIAASTPFVLLAGWPDDVALQPRVVALAGFVLVIGGFTRSLIAVRSHKNAERTLAWQASHDSLTGLSNRAVLTEELGVAARRATRRRSHWAVLFCDLDEFKVINDSLGHAIGDSLLVAVADRLRDAFGDAALVARLGGDEFVVLSTQDGEVADESSLARRVVEAFAEPFPIAGNELHVSASVGMVTDAQSKSLDPETILRDADIAMYAAKGQGRGRVEAFQPRMHDRVRDRLATEVALRRALVEGGLVLAYQPVVSLVDGSLVASEALLRWNRGAHLAMPSEFVPLAEDLGLIVDIGAWVLRRAAQHVAAVQAIDPAARVAVNVSARELREPDMARLAEEILLTENVTPDAIVLEVTESALLEPTATVRRNLAALHDAGFRFAIDDFGTGYSSLASLRQLDVDTLKIDQVFTAGLDGSTEDATLVRAIVNMAHSLGLKVTAEGVERPGQLDVLHAMGCDSVQGYLIGPPEVPEPALTATRGAPRGLLDQSNAAVDLLLSSVRRGVEQSGSSSGS